MTSRTKKGEGKPLVSGRTLGRMLRPPNQRGSGGPVRKWIKRLRYHPDGTPVRTRGVAAMHATYWGSGFEPGGGWRRP